MEVFVQSNFDESTINLIVNKKLIEQQKNKNNLLKIEKNKKAEEVIKKNQSKDSWKEVKQNSVNNFSNNNNSNNNQKYKKSKYKGHNNYISNYNQNHSSHYYYPNNKKYYRHSKNYKYNRQKNYIEREVEINSKGEIDNEIIEDSLEIKAVSDSNSKNSKNGNDVISQENTEETSAINNLELLNLNLSKCQSEELNHKNYDLHDVGVKLFPGIYKNKNYNLELGKNNKSINNININNYMNINSNEEEIKKTEDLDNFVDKNKCINNKNDIKYNFLYKADSNIIKGEQKKGLALAVDYYSSFLEDTKNNK